MTNFALGILQNLIADAIVVSLGLLVALMIAMRTRWRLIGAFIRLFRNGVSNLFVNRSEYISRRSRTVEEMIESAKRDFTYIGIYFSLATDQSRIDSSIKNLIAQKCKVTIALFDSESPQGLVSYLEAHLAFAANSLSARAKHAADYFVGLRNSLAPAERAFLDVRLHQVPLTTSAFILDKEEKARTILIDQKWYGVGRDKSFGIEFSTRVGDDSLQATILASFGKVLENSRSI